MRSRKIAVAVSGAVAFMALFVAFTLVLYVGADQLLKMDSSAKAALLVHDLQAIRSGANDKLIKAKEIQWLFWPFSEGYDHEKYLRAVALYRKNHPSPTATLEFGGDDEQRRNMKDNRTEVLTRTTQLLERYGQ